MRQTVFTPTYNRAKLLPRLYASLVKQSFKDFEWLIIDDGSTDNTEEVVNGFIAENKIRIKYVKKDNGGKYTAQYMAYSLAETPYVTEIDSDDYFLEDAVEKFEQAWISIEVGNCSNIGKVSMFDTYENGGRPGNGDYTMNRNIKFIDATWHELVLKQHCHKELASSISRKCFLDTVHLDKYDWHIGKFLDESVIWSAIGRKWKTRLLNTVGLVVCTDADNSLLRNDSVFTDMSKLSGVCANSLYFIDENIDYLTWNPRYFIGHYRRMIRSAKGAKIGFREILSQFKSRKAKVMFTLLYLPFNIHCQ